MIFGHIWLLLSVLVMVPLILHYVRKSRALALPFPSLSILRHLKDLNSYSWLRHVPIVLRCLALFLCALALARPQAQLSRNQRSTEGLDIVLVIDTSRSMEARDFVIENERPNRLTVIKKVIAEFIANRSDDRIGMVVFGSEAFTQAPLTLDHTLLLNFLERIEIGMAGDATAIGDSLATAVNRLKEVQAKSKIVILLTDGSNTSGRVDPLAAGQAAKSLGVKVYTVGVGKEGMVPVVVGGQVKMQKTEIDEALLKTIAKETGGKYFRATDTETLQNIYYTIDKLEKTTTTNESFEKRDERFAGFVIASLLLLFGELAFSLTRFRSLP